MESSKKNKRVKVPWLNLIKKAHMEDEFEIYCFIHGRETRHSKGISLNRCARAFCVKHKLFNKQVKKDYSTLDKCVKEFNNSFGFVG